MYFAPFLLFTCLQGLLGAPLVLPNPNTAGGGQDSHTESSAPPNDSSRSLDSDKHIRLPLRQFLELASDDVAANLMHFVLPSEGMPPSSSMGTAAIRKDLKDTLQSSLFEPILSDFSVKASKRLSLLSQGQEPLQIRKRQNNNNPLLTKGNFVESWKSVSQSLIQDWQETVQDHPAFLQDDGLAGFLERHQGLLKQDDGIVLEELPSRNTAYVFHNAFCLCLQCCFLGVLFQAFQWKIRKANTRTEYSHKRFANRHAHIDKRMYGVAIAEAVEHAAVAASAGDVVKGSAQSGLRMIPSISKTGSSKIGAVWDRQGRHPSHSHKKPPVLTPAGSAPVAEGQGYSPPYDITDDAVSAPDNGEPEVPLAIRKYAEEGESTNEAKNTDSLVKQQTGAWGAYMENEGSDGRPETFYESHSSKSNPVSIHDITPAEDSLPASVSDVEDEFKDADSNAFAVSDEIEALNAEKKLPQVFDIEPVPGMSAQPRQRKSFVQPQHPHKPYLSIVKQGPSPPNHVSFETLAIAKEEERAASATAKEGRVATIKPEGGNVDVASTSDIIPDDMTVSTGSPIDSSLSETTLDDASATAASSEDGKIADVSSEDGSVAKLTDGESTFDASSTSNRLHRLASVVYSSPPVTNARALYTAMPLLQTLPGHMIRYSFQFMGLMLVLTHQLSNLLFVKVLPAVTLTREAIGFVAEKARLSIMEGPQVVLDAVNPAAKVVEDKTMKLIETAAKALAHGLFKGAAQQGPETMGANAIEELGAYLQETLVATGREFAKAGLGEIYHEADKAKGAARRSLAKMKTFIKPALMVAVPSFLLLLSLILLLSVLVGK